MPTTIVRSSVRKMRLHLGFEDVVYQSIQRPAGRRYSLGPIDGYCCDGGGQNRCSNGTNEPTYASHSQPL
jgi:hypothetical protein